MKLGFVTREAFVGLRRNVTMSIAMVITTAISLALLTTGWLLTEMTDRTKDIYIDKVEVMIQLSDEISVSDATCVSPQCANLRTTLENDPGVESVTFRSKEQSYQRFVELFQATDPELVAQTSEDAFPAALHVRLVDPTETASIDAIREAEGVAHIVDQGEELQEATRNLDAVKRAAFVVAGVQALASVFLIMNMVQITAFTRRSEISIMRMVGATRWFTQAPFVLEAVIGAITGAVLAIGGLLAVKTLVVDRALDSLYQAQLVAPITTGDIWAAAPVIVLLGALVAAVTAQIALRLYVRD